MKLTERVSVERLSAVARLINRIPLYLMPYLIRLPCNQSVHFLLKATQPMLSPWLRTMADLFIYLLIYLVVNNVVVYFVTFVIVFSEILAFIIATLKFEEK